jgi:2'-5' RNA ligase superfamily
MSRPPSTGVVVPVDAARELVAPWQHLLPAAGRSLPPHVTALWPFLPVTALDGAAEQRLEELLSGAQPFAFALARVATLADATVLVPEPAEPFAALTRLLWDEWPEYPPFGGAFDDIAPHVVVAIDPSAADRAEIETVLTPLLPLEARATEVLLVEETGSGALRERRRFFIGGPQA